MMLAGEEGLPPKHFSLVGKPKIGGGFRPGLSTLAPQRKHLVMRSGRKKTTLVPLKDIMESILKDSKLPFNPDDARIWAVWDEVVGPSISKNAQPLWIKHGRLRVNVTDPIWLQELGFLKQNIKEKLNEKLGRDAVRVIEFRLKSR